MPRNSIQTIEARGHRGRLKRMTTTTVGEPARKHPPLAKLIVRQTYPVAGEREVDVTARGETRSAP